MISIGSIKLKDIYGGADKIRDIYIGSNQIWTNFQMFFTQSEFEQDELNDRIILKIIQNSPISETLLNELTYSIDNEELELGETINEVSISDPIIDSELNEISFKVNTSFKGKSFKNFKVIHADGASASIKLRYWTNYITAIKFSDSEYAYYNNGTGGFDPQQKSIGLEISYRDNSKDPDDKLTTIAGENNLCTYTLSGNELIFNANPKVLNNTSSNFYVTSAYGYKSTPIKITYGRQYIKNITIEDLDNTSLIVGKTNTLPASIEFSALDYYNGDDTLYATDSNIKYTGISTNSISIFVPKKANAIESQQVQIQALSNLNHEYVLPLRMIPLKPSLFIVIEINPNDVKSYVSEDEIEDITHCSGNYHMYRYSNHSTIAEGTFDGFTIYEYKQSSSDDYPYYDYMYLLVAEVYGLDFRWDDTDIRLEVAGRIYFKESISNTSFEYSTPYGDLIHVQSDGTVIRPVSCRVMT